MTKLTPRDHRILDEVFEMQQGYVLNFSDRTMSQFFDYELSVDIDAEKYCRSGTSKAKRVRCFLATENPAIVAKTLRSLWDYRESIKEPIDEKDEKEKRLRDRFFELLNSIEGNNELARTDAIDQFIENETLQELVLAIERDIQANKPEAALDRLHTYCMKKFAHLLDQHKVEFDKDEPLKSRAGKYFKAIQSEAKIRDISLKIMKSAISVFDSYNQIRNNESFAHDNELVDRSEARFIFDSITNILRFVKAFEAKRFGD
jgi:abortive infection Abi-like protein